MHPARLAAKPAPLRYIYVLAGFMHAEGLHPEGRWPLPDFKAFADLTGARLAHLGDLRFARFLPRRLKDAAVVRKVLGLLLVLRLLLFSRADVLVFSGEDIGLFGGTLARVLRPSLPIVIITHGPNMRGRVYGPMVRWCAGSRNVVFACLSQSLADEVTMTHRLAAGAAQSVGYGIDTSFFECADPPAGTIVSSAGASHRDYPVLIAAARDLDVDLKIAAASTWVTEGAAAAEETGQSRIEMRSWGDYRNLRELYRSSVLVAVPTVDAPCAKGFAVIGEAMAMGRPVIATRGQVWCDFIEEGVTGFLVPPGDVGAMRQRISALLDDRARAASMGAAAAKAIHSEFSLEAYSGRIAALATELHRRLN